MVRGVNDVSSGKMLSKLKFKNLKNADKENLNIYIVRQVRKLILQILDNKLPKTQIFTVNICSNYLICLYMLILKSIGSSKIQYKDFKSMSKPACDQPKAKTNVNLHYKCYSNDFLNTFFSIKPVQDVFYILISSIQEDKCEILNEKFNFKCCDSTTVHSPQCKKIWKEFKEYIKSSYLKSFNIEILSEYSKISDGLNMSTLFEENLAYSLIAN